MLIACLAAEARDGGPDLDTIDLSEIRRLYRHGVNVMDYLRGKLGTKYNTEQLVEASYDLQAGSYVEYVEDHREHESLYQRQVAEVLAAVIAPGDSIADVGTGEMTTLSPVAACCYGPVSTGYAIDISLSRLIVGERYLEANLASEIRRRIRSVSASLFRLPLADSSVDVVWTSHALEPNGTRELEGITELVRAARRYVVLFEPSYEHASVAGKERMDRLGYIKRLETTIRSIPGVELDAMIKMIRPEEDLNVTFAHVIRKRHPESGRADVSLRCPLTYGALDARAGYLFSKNALLAYPILERIPILRVDKAICASILDDDRNSK